MIPRIFLAALALAAGTAHADSVRGSGTPATEQRAASGIHGVALAIFGHVEVTQGDHEGVTVTADDNVLPYIVTDVRDGVLEIRTRPNTSLSTKTPLSVKIVARSLDQVRVSGSGDVVATKVETPKLALHISGSGDVKLAGHSQALEARISGSGRVDATKLAVDDASIDISGSGRLALSARKTLKTRISGSGDLEYYGDPVVEQRISGVGRVRRAGAAPA
jgi:hypothetical protein